MRKKWIIIPATTLLVVAVFLWVISRREPPVEVVGKLPEKDVAEITALLKRDMARRILPDFSWQSVKHMPKALKHNFSIKLIAVVVNSASSVMAIAWLNTNGVPHFTHIIEDNKDEWATILSYKLKTMVIAIPNSIVFTMYKDSNGWKTLFVEEP
jgi:hypothetical protein